ncbi:MAG: hypothetical protein K2M73_07965 [Lachnospiraceae bacterium]|nr:hypothetical protein [Lachnospiraceae bacterium]
MPQFYIIQFILSKFGIKFTGEQIFKGILVISVIAVIFIIGAWIKGILDQNEEYANRIKLYEEEVTILRNNETKLKTAIDESRNKLEEISVSLKEKTIEFEEWRKKEDHEKYSSQMLEIFNMIKTTKDIKTLDACININKKISGLKYEDF